MILEDQEIVTVAIPAYNCADSIHRAIDSVLEQTYQSFKILIVEDVSTDNTKNVLSRLEDPRIRIVYHEYNQGEGGARNTCFEHCETRLLAFLDSDDEWLPDKLSTQLTEFLALDNEFTALIHSAELVNMDTGKTRIVRETADAFHNNWTEYFLGQCGVNAGTTMMTTVESYRRVGPYESRLRRRTDHDWLLRFTAKGGRFVSSDTAPLARIYYSAKASPDVLADATELFLERNQDIYQTFPMPIQRHARSLLFFQMAEGYFIHKQYVSYLRMMLRCLPLNPKQASIGIVWVIYKLLRITFEKNPTPKQAEK